MAEPLFWPIANLLTLALRLIDILKKHFKDIKNNPLFLTIISLMLILFLVYIHFYSVYPSSPKYIPEDVISSLDANTASIEELRESVHSILENGRPNIFIDMNDAETRRFVSKEVEKLVKAIRNRNL